MCPRGQREGNASIGLLPLQQNTEFVKSIAFIRTDKTNKLKNWLNWYEAAK